MTLNDTPSANRIHIGIFGRTNAGKSSLMNAITNQTCSLVSDIKGTTTDSVRKAMELLPLGPVVFIDTPGLYDDTELGVTRQKIAFKELDRIDFALLVIDVTQEDTILKKEHQLLKNWKQRNLPFFICINKCDTKELRLQAINLAQTQFSDYEANTLFISTSNSDDIELLKNRLGSLQIQNEQRTFIKDCLKPLDEVILVIPIDSGAPKGRIILPQQQVLRELLEAGMITTVVTPESLAEAINRGNPKVVITDSQVFHVVSQIVPKEIFLTSFSILMARYKGTLHQAVSGANVIDTLPAHARILISEGCSHHRQCEDIGTVKLPKWIRERTQKDFSFTFTNGREFPEQLSDYDLIIHCGGCTLNETEIKNRYRHAKEQLIPITNYGIFIAYIRGILERSIEIFQ